MNAPQPHKWADVLKALADGHTIQYKYFDGDWDDYEPCHSAAFSPLYCLELHSWRVKPATRTGWINIYPYGSVGDIYNSKNQADRECQPNRIACILITYTEGEGLTPND